MKTTSNPGLFAFFSAVLISLVSLQASAENKLGFSCSKKGKLIATYAYVPEKDMMCLFMTENFRGNFKVVGENRMICNLKQVSHLVFKAQGRNVDHWTSKVEDKYELEINVSEGEINLELTDAESGKEKSYSRDVKCNQFVMDGTAPL